MFKVVLPKTHDHVFFDRDPREEGFVGDVCENVALECPENVDLWPLGSARPEVCLGSSKSDSNHYHVFRSPQERRAAGFEPVEGDYGGVYGTWRDSQRGQPVSD